MTVVDLQCCSNETYQPDLSLIEQVVSACLSATASQLKQPEVTIRLVDEPESQKLNHQYRNKNAPTNVLSFPFDAPPGVPVELLGDLVICLPVVRKEAEQQTKTLDHHFLHLVVHGCLHLLGFDHLNDEDAEVMESLEVRVLSQFNIPDPYQESGE